MVQQTQLNITLHVLSALFKLTPVLPKNGAADRV